MSDVLIVDDEPTIRRLVTRMLQPLGCDARVAANANEALALIATAAPGVIVCDVHMPGSNGLWLADRVRDLCPTTAIVLATGDQGVPPEESLRKGVVAYVLKPFRRAQLVGAVREGLRWSANEETKRARTTGAARRLLNSSSS